MKKVLFAANLDSFFMKFLIPQLKYFKEKGYEVHIAAKSQNIDVPYCDKKFNVSFARGFSFKDNVKSYRKMKEILQNNHYDLISCHTPFGGAITRLAAKNIVSKDTKIVYTAHGFHFYKGAPLKNWLVYYPVEKYLAKYTTAIITINEEDYHIADQKMKAKAYFIPGIGISKEKFDFQISKEEKKGLYQELNIHDKDYIMIFPGEINSNKNQKLLLDALKILKDKIPNIVLLLPGNDLTKGKYLEYAEKIGVADNVRFLGFRRDIPKLLSISNLSVSSSKREGLPINIVEAMYMGLPVVATNCRGNRDLIKDGENGFLVYKNSPKEFADKIEKLYKDPKLANTFARISKKNVEKYLLDNVLNEIIKVYEE